VVAPISSELLRAGGTLELPMIVWHLAQPLLAISSAPLGGGLGLRSWVVNAEVAAGYSRRDPDRHLGELAVAVGLSGHGVGMLTAASIAALRTATDEGVRVDATVGTEHPTWAAADDGFLEISQSGTINVVAFVPARLSDGALVNAVVTVTEAKSQALSDAGVAGTGTASDAVCILCLADGAADAFCGPRSLWGARLARATYMAVSAGCIGDSAVIPARDDAAGGLGRRPGTTAS